MGKDNELDLDALMPQSLTLTFNGQTINVQPPKTGDLLRLGQLSQRMRDIEGDTPEEINTKVEDITEAICKIIPELSTTQLSLGQLQGLIGKLTEMSMPPDLKALTAKGITPADTKKAQ